MNNPKVLLFDEETAPSLGWYFDLWKEGNIVATKIDWYMLSVAYKWLGERQVKAIALPDFKGYKPGSENDEELIKALWKLFDEADILIAHNGDQFDIKKANARFAYYNLPPPSPYKTIDTKKVAKRYFNFTSNRLDDLGAYFGFGRKMVHTGFDLWKRCMAGDPAAWKMMVAYNKRDVILLEKIYLHLRPWITNHPTENFDGCSNCPSLNLSKQGIKRTRTGYKQQFKCADCGAWKSIAIKKIEYAR